MASDQQHFDRCREFQEYYQTSFRNIDVSVPAPSPGQKVNDYRREALRRFKRTFLPRNHELYRVQMRALPDDAIGPIEPQVLKACDSEAINPANFKPDELRMYHKTDPQTGVKTNNFYGQQHFVRLPNFGTGIAMAGGFRPGRRVLAFRRLNVETLDNYNRGNERMRQVANV